MHLSHMLKVAFLSHRKLGPLDSMLEAKFHPQVHYRPAKTMLLACPHSSYLALCILSQRI